MTTTIKTSHGSNKWGDKCITNFSILTETSSKESIQTFVKWIFFNRKQYLHFISALQNYISTTSATSSNSIYSILLTVLHEVLILNYSTTDKWNMTSELRIAFGESLVLPYALQFPRTKLETYMQQWDTYNVFDTPTVLRQIRNKLHTASNITTATATSTTASVPVVLPQETQTGATAAATVVEEISKASSSSPDTDTATAAVENTTNPVGSEETVPILATSDPEESVIPADITDVIDVEIAAEPGEQKEDSAPPAVRSRKGKSRPKADDDDEVVIVEKEKDALDLLIEGKSNRSITSLPSSTTAAGMTKFDFDAHPDIPMTKVHPNEFIEPCRLIATLQIARDLRNDSAVQISSFLQSLPESVRRFIAEAAEAMDDTPTTNTYELSDSTAREFVKIMNEQLLDMNINEQLENVKTFMELIQRQRKARETIHHLLIASRCQFGANDVAATYNSMDEVYRTLKQRTQTLADAMDLEGFEVQPVNPAIAAMTQLEKELPPFPWYNNETNDDNAAVVEVDNASPCKRQKT